MFFCQIHSVENLGKAILCVCQKSRSKNNFDDFLPSFLLKFKIIVLFSQLKLSLILAGSSFSINLKIYIYGLFEARKWYIILIHICCALLLKEE